MKSIVVPGEMICVEEEFTPLEGVYTLDGIVRASTVGIPMYDTVGRKVYVKPIKNLKRPKSGDVVIGVVDRVRDEMATVKIVGYDVASTFKHTFTGILHVSQVMDSRIQSIHDYVKLGDFVKVKILNSYIPYIVSMKDPKLGVVLAYCSRCGFQLVKAGDTLKCMRCGNIENRKISTDYMLVKGR